VPEEALERRADAEQRSAHAQVARVGLELDPHRVPVLEGVPEQEVLRLDVRAGAPLPPLEPRPADLRAAVGRLDVEVARGADRTIVDVDDERDLGLVLEGDVEPAVEAERVHVREAVDVRLALSRLAQSFAVALCDPLDAHDASLERGGGTELAHGCT